MNLPQATPSHIQMVMAALQRILNMLWAGVGKDSTAACLMSLKGSSAAVHVGQEGDGLGKLEAAMG